MSATTLQRTHFDISRAAEYFDLRELQAMTGQPDGRLADVALKELADNALDAAETAGVPPVLTISVEYPGEHTIRLTVEDNGEGIPPGVVRRILNFDTRTSDKSAYRAPTRGAQGNALKTVLGMPCAMGIAEPVTIEAAGVCHSIRAWIDPAGELRIDHDEEQDPIATGTTVSLPLREWTQQQNPLVWARAFSLFNPHALVRIRALGECMPANWFADDFADSYQPTVAFPGEWRKFLPTDLTSPWWYDEASLSRLVFAHIGAYRRGGADLLLRSFVKQFKGLSANAKAKLVCDRLPEVSHLSDFESRPQAVHDLHAAMRGQVPVPPSANVLGFVGEEHFRARFNEWYGVKRLWYRKVTGEAAGAAFVCEVVVAETRRPGALFTAVNFSPTFDDPTAGQWLRSEKVCGMGIGGYLQCAHAHPEREHEPCTAAAVHIIMPVVQTLDRGKTRVPLPDPVRIALQEALWRTCKDLHEEAERRSKDAAKEQRRARERERIARAPRVDLRRAVFEVVPQAYFTGTGGGRYFLDTRDFYYEVRPLLQALTDRELDYDYFSQRLCRDYQRLYKPLPLLCFKPRGILYEPHTGREVPLGTREVEAYQFPAWLYDKILYIEKSGVAKALITDRLGERYDMAIVAAEGYATEATRILFANAQRDRQYQLFVLHDADPYGHNIARTLREETATMPGYAVEVIDLGLTLAEAEEMGLQRETFTRKRHGLPSKLTLTDEEQAVFTQERLYDEKAQKYIWLGERVEINAIPVPERCAFIERKLQEHGATGKVIPDDESLARLSEGIYADVVGREVEAIVSRLVSADSIRECLVREYRERFPMGQAREWIENVFACDRRQAWRDAVAAGVREMLHQKCGDLESAVRKALAEAR